jgi:hypothetical protein
MLSEELSRIIEGAAGEREVSRFLAEHPEIVRWAFCWTGGHSTYVIKEFPFGSRYRADFVVPMSYSGRWEVQMIELEPPDDKVINKDGTASHRLNKAIAQIHDWASYIEQNPYSFRKDLSDWCVDHDLLGVHSKKRPPCNYTGDYLKDQDTHIGFYYHIVIGSREQVTREQRRKMNQFSRGIHVRVCTYGRFLDIARNLDKREANPNEGVCLTDTEENDT